MNHFGYVNFPVSTKKEHDVPILEALIGPIVSLIDKVIPDKAQRDKAKLELLQLQGSQDLAEINSRLSAIVAEANSHDPWTSRARPSFLYVMYLLLLWALPMGLLAAFSPAKAQEIAAGMNAYLSGLPEPLYALFGTGYLGYTAARQWGKIAGSDK
jgi:Holin of 3TMs, for gene-transfer release